MQQISTRIPNSQISNVTLEEVIPAINTLIRRVEALEVRLDEQAPETLGEKFGLSAEEAAEATLPSDIPHRDLLVKAGVTAEDLPATDVTAVPGIGPAKAANIHEYLKVEA